MTEPLVVLEEAAIRESLEERGARLQKRRHVEMLVIGAVATACAFVLTMTADGRLAFVGWPLPESCMSRAVMHVACPGCGLTRSVVLLAHGSLQGSLAMHRLGWIFALAIAAQVPYRIAALWSAALAPLGHVFPRVFGWTLIALLVGNWLVGVVFRLGN